MDDDIMELQKSLYGFSGLSEEDFLFGKLFWYRRTIKKGDFFNTQGIVCKELGYITKGLFRLYRYDDGAEEERNLNFFSENQFLSSFPSFVAQYPCSYFIEALEDSEYLAIKHEHLQQLYERSNTWNSFGRKLAEGNIIRSQIRIDSLLFLNHEQQYVQLLEEHPTIAERVPLYHISSYLGIKNPSLSRIRKRIREKKAVPPL
ncbi:MAG: Crp/Fnr family transcriptional regulator [Sediminicola sp.]